MFKFFKKLGRKVGKIYNKAVKTIGKAVKAISQPRTSATGLTSEERLAIQFADAPYKQPRPSRIGIYEYLPMLSTDEIAVYQHAKDYKMCIRGTKALRDIATDIEIIKGNETATPRFKRDLATYDRLQLLGKVTVYGHSLGGLIAIYIGRMRNAVGYAINPAVSLTTNLDSGRVKIIRSSSDFVSALGLFKRKDIKTVNIDDNDDTIAGHRLSSFQ